MLSPEETQQFTFYAAVVDSTDRLVIESISRSVEEVHEKMESMADRRKRHILKDGGIYRVERFLLLPFLRYKEIEQDMAATERATRICNAFDALKQEL